VTVPLGTPNQETALLLKEQLAAAGIEAELLFFEPPMAQGFVRRSAFQSALLPLTAPVADPDYLLGRRYVTRGAENYTKYSNPAVDELFMRQGQMLDPAERRELVSQMERLVLEDAPAVVLWWQDTLLGRRGEVRNFHLGPGQSTNLSFQEVWLEE